ncbi:MAG: DUF3800 domain-containing protein [Bacilli bacterium]|nr:DUF3800 domain-containing protein [Bacilli bacterium]
MGTGNWGPSKCGGLFPLFFFKQHMNNKKTLNIYIDESGDESQYSTKNSLYVVSFLCVEDEKLSNSAIKIFRQKLKNAEGGSHFVHVGNLVRKEKPYNDMQREKRKILFHDLFLLCEHSTYKYFNAVYIKKQRNQRTLIENISKCIFKEIEKRSPYFNQFDVINFHYDGGQAFLKGVFASLSSSIVANARYVDTQQKDHPFMQASDLLSYMELVWFHACNGQLTESEIKFFGLKRKIKKDYIRHLNTHRF